MNPEITKIMGVVQRAVNLSKEGSGSLNENLAEFCKEAGFNAEEIKRAAEWSNTLNQLKLYKAGADKTTEFDVADAEVVTSMIFKEASPSDLEKESSYADHPDLYYSLKKKAGAKEITTKGTLSDYKAYSPDLVKQAYLKVSQLKEQHRTAQGEKVLAEDRFYNKMTKIASNLDRLYSESFAEFEQGARDALGQRADSYLNVLEKMAGANNKRLLNYTPKNIITRSENVELLKEAMANCNLVAVFNNVSSRTEQAIDSCNERLATYAREKFSKSV